MSKDGLNCVVSHIMQVSPIMIILRISPDGWELPEFKPGQFVALYLPASAKRCESATPEIKELPPEKMIRRAYSIASSSRTREYLEFYVTLVHSGALTPRLFALKIGDRIGLGKKCVGMFTLDEVPEDSNVALVATGTGVAPYMSMLRSGIMANKNRKFAVIHGAANSWDLGYASELNLLESITDNFDYYPTILMPEKEHATWNGDTRFVQDMWADGIIEKKWGFKPTPENTHVFLCGNPLMVEAMMKVLEVDNFKEHSRKSAGEIHIEKF